MTTALTPQEEIIRRDGLEWLDQNVMIETDGGPLPLGLLLPGIIRRTLREELRKLRAEVREEVAAMLRDRETAAP